MTDPANPQARATSRRDLRLVVALALLAAIAWACLTPLGGWVQSFFFGTGVRWQNAYVALDAAEMNLPRDPRERERLLLANAMVNGEPPIGMKMGPRLHPPGTLAHLKYEIFDENGDSMDTWEVRALVPNIGNGEGPFWRAPCAKACADEIAQSNGTHIQRSGDAGIAEEYVLRMPVGETFSLRPAPLHTQDILDKRQRIVPIGAVTVDGKSVQVPSKILVTLVKACAADVRVGTAMNMRFAENVTIPFPLGFTVSRWAQLDGCGKLERFAPPPAAPPVIARNVKVDPPDLHAVIVQRDAKTGFATLKVDEAWLQKHNMPVVFNLSLLCRYDAATDRWQRLPPPDMRASFRLVPLSAADAAPGNRVTYEVPQETALFWLHWMEQNEVNVSARLTAYRDALVVSGPVLCNDVELGEPPAGKVAACVPFANRAEARFVPTPAKACSQ